MNASGGMSVGPKAPLHHQWLDATVPGSVANLGFKRNSLIYTSIKDPEASTWDFTIDFSQPSSTSEAFQNPYSLEAIELGSHRRGNITGGHISQTDITQREVHFGEISLQQQRLHQLPL